MVQGDRFVWATAILGDRQQDWATLVSREDEEKTREFLHMHRDTIRFDGTDETDAECQEVLLRVARYIEPVECVSRACIHVAHIIAMQQDAMDLKTQHF